jgi:hypothetical protein
MDDGTSERKFVHSRGLLFAREALTSRPVVGEEYYRSLVGSAGWMRSELPRLYARWDPVPAEVVPAPAPTPWAIGLLNRVLFPLVSTYLQLQGLVRNHRLRVTGHPERAFRTLPRYRSMMFATERFERLRRAHETEAAPRAVTA